MSTVTEVVQERYAEAAKQVARGRAATCCGSSADTSDGLSCCDPITGNLYSELEAGQVPGDALLASLGCGNPTALAALQPGQTVLDLGSGGGIDVILSARRVGPTGKAYGLDMTDEMLALARANAAKAEAGNVQFLKGHIEAVPLPNDAVDVIISNCVINLSVDKARVLAEAFRVLKPGGRLAVSDVVLRGAIPEDVRRSMELWVGCVAGALTEENYRSLLTAAGFTNVDIETTRVYDIEDARVFLSSSGLDVDTVAPLVQGRVTSAFIRATKPRLAPGTCCGPDCCP